MCGIIGTASTEGMKNRSARSHFMKVGLDIDSWRGWESTGLAFVHENSEESNPIIYKRALNGRDFFQLNHVEKYLNDIEKYPVVIGHNRAATAGRGNIVDHNAHPFQYGDITLVHNGHIRNTHELNKANQEANCLVDSSHVAWAMNNMGEQEVLERVEGGFVFVWWNNKTKLLNIARNTERPLHMAYAAKENTLYWASELTQLLHLLKDVDIDEDAGILYPKAWNWYQYDLKDLREFKKIPFVKSQGRHSTSTTGTSVTTGGPTRGAIHGIEGWTDEEIWAAHAEYVTSLETNPEGTPSTGMSDSEEIEEIRKDVANTRLKEAKASGVPTAKKRIERAKVELRKLGLEYKEMRNCIPISWAKYKNQDNLGSVLARTKKEGHLVEVLQVRHETYKEYAKYDNLLVDCVNVRLGPKNDFRIVAIISPRQKMFMERQKSKEGGTKGGSDEDKSLSGGSIARELDGPDGAKISLAKFEEYVGGGCINCKRIIDPKFHGAITWVGRPPLPICPTCGADEAILELLGVTEEYRRKLVH